MHVRPGFKILNDHVEQLNLKSCQFTAYCGNDKIITSDSVILATGAQAKWLGLPSETYFRGFGVSACATCDGFFFRDQEVIVVGGGNTAVEEALFLTNFATKVTLVHRRDELRAEKILQVRLFKHPKIHTMWHSELIEVIGDKTPRAVNGARIRHRLTGDIIDLSCSGIFIAIGHSPASELVHGQLDMREGGYVVTKEGSTATSFPGVFAAGDIVDSVYRQAVTSAGMGCMAALDTERYLSSLK